MTRRKDNAEIWDLVKNLGLKIEDGFNNMKSLETRLENGFNDIKDDIISLKDTVIKRLVEENARLNERVKTLEIEIYNSQQYSRRNNIVLSGIPNHVDDASLEEKVIKIFKSIDVEVHEKEIEACHRLPTSNETRPKNTIVRFVNRKSCEEILRKRKKFQHSDKTSLGFPESNSVLCK